MNLRHVAAVICMVATFWTLVYLQSEREVLTSSNSEFTELPAQKSVGAGHSERHARKNRHQITARHSEHHVEKNRHERTHPPSDDVTKVPGVQEEKAVNETNQTTTALTGRWADISCENELNQFIEGMKDEYVPIEDPKSVVILSLFGGAGTIAVSDLVLENRERYCKKHGYTCLSIFSKAVGEKPTVKGLDDFMPDEGYDDRGFMWAKPYLIWQLLRTRKDVSYIFLLDADMILTNHGVGLDFLAGQGKSMIVGVDVYGLNTGALFIRSEKYMVDFFEEVWSVYPSDTASHQGEQPAIILTIFESNATGLTFKERGQRYNHLYHRSIKELKGDRHASKRHVDFRVGQVRTRAEETDDEKLLDSLRHVLVAPQCITNTYRREWSKGDFLMHLAGNPMAFKTTCWKHFNKHLECWIQDYDPDYVKEYKTASGQTIYLPYKNLDLIDSRERDKCIHPTWKAATKKNL